MQKGQLQILILAGVLVIAVLVGGAYYFTKPTSPICIQIQAWAKSPLGGECKAFPTPCDVPKFWVKCTPPSVSESPQPSPTPSTIPDETANWKTYTNATYAFQFLYPPSWDYKSEPNYPNVIFFSPHDIEFPPPGYAGEGMITPVEVIVRSGINVQKEVEDFKKAYQYTNYKDETVVVGGVQARKISGVVTAESYVQNEFNAEVFIPKQNYVVQISFLEREGVDEKLLNQILTSFKFLQ